MSQELLRDASFFAFLVKCDAEMAAEVKAAGCPCGGKLDASPFPRKPRGGIPAELKGEYSKRHSFSCRDRDCRERATPPSLRFFGSRLYCAPVFVLVWTMTDGITDKRAAELKQAVGVSIRTLHRWRAWWRETFAKSRFWKSARARLDVPVDAEDLPTSLLERFAGVLRDRLVACLRFLAPVTARPGLAGAV